MSINKLFDSVLYWLGVVTLSVGIGTFIGLLVTGSTLSLKVQIP